MWVFIAIVAAFLMLMALLIKRTRWERRRVRAFFETDRGIVRKVEPDPRHFSEYAVVFQSNLDELRRAIVRVRHGLVEVIEDQPYHHTLTRPQPFRPGTIALDQLAWLAEQSKLPGRSEYAQIILGLVAGPHAIEIAETERRFRSVLQFIEMQAMTTEDPESGVLGLVVNQKSVLATWRVDGRSPNRVLAIGCTLK